MRSPKIPLAKIIENKMGERDYLEGERVSEIKHEYIDGSIYAMSGASKNQPMKCCPKQLEDMLKLLQKEDNS